MNEGNIRREVDGLRAAINSLSSQLSALEQRLDADTEKPLAPPPDSIAEHRSTLDALRARKYAAAGTPSPTPPATPHAGPDEQPGMPAELAAPPIGIERLPAHRAPRADRPSRTIADLEWLVGTRGIALLGVIILVIAAVFFLKEAWDRGWIGQLPDWLRCSLAAAFGGVLITVGEVIRRKINPLASSGISAAGIAIVFGSILAATRLYGLLPLPTAFVLLFLTTLAGILLGALSTRVILAALSLVGAFLVPVVLSTGEPSLVIMPVYLVALLGMGLGLAGWKGHAFASIRRLAWWGTAVLGSVWAAGLPGESAAMPAALFAGTVWLLTSMELIASARFMPILRAGRSWPDKLASGFVQPRSGAPITFNPRAFLAPEARWINAAFGATAWAAALAVLSIRRQAPDLDWVAPAGLAAAAVLLAVVTAQPIAALCRPGATARSTLAAAFWLNAAAMLGLTIATALHDSTQVIAWVLTGLAAVVFGVRARFATSAVIGLAFMAVAGARLITYDLVRAYGSDGTVIADALGIVLTKWSIQTMMLAGAATVSAFLLRRSTLGVVVAACAISFTALSLIGPGSSWISVAAAWAAAGAALVHAGSRIRRQDIEIAGASLIGIATPIIAIVGFDRYSVSPGAQDGNAISWTTASWAFAILSVAWLAASAAPRRGRPVRSSAAAVGVLCLAAAGVGDGTPAQTLLVFWAGIVATTLAVSTIGNRKGDPLLRDWRLPHLSIVLASSLALVWCGNQLGRDWQEITAPPLIHAAVLSAAIITATLAFAGRLCTLPRFLPDATGHNTAAPLRALAYATAIGLALALSSAELVRIIGLTESPREIAIGPALSVWWSLFAIAVVAVGFRRRLPAARWAGLGLLTVTAGKGIFIDLAAFDGLTRIGGSTVVGLLLLVVGIAYTRFNASLGRTPPPAGKNGPSTDPPPGSHPGSPIEPEEPGGESGRPASTGE